jgi:hypothetical protein
MVYSRMEEMYSCMKPRRLCRKHMSAGPEAGVMHDDHY